MKLKLRAKQLWLSLAIAPLGAPLLAIASGVAVSFVEPSVAAESVSITCNTEGVPSVVAIAKKDNQEKSVTMLNFLEKYFTPEEAKQNCLSTAQKIQNLYSNGEDFYITSDLVEDKTVVCTVSRRGSDSCGSKEAQQLFALSEPAEPIQALYEMLGDEFKNQDGDNTRTISRIYTDIEPRNLWQIIFGN